VSARLNAALEYESQGRSVIPVAPGGKVPAIAWQRYQTRRATPERIRLWWGRADFNVGIVTGAISDLVVVDCDFRAGGAQSLAKLEAQYGTLQAAEVATPNGAHLWFRHPGRRVPNSVGLLGPGLDVRADGGLVVAPPSIRDDGAYSWCSLLSANPATLPGWLARLVMPPVHPPTGRPSTAPGGGGNYLERAISGILADLAATTPGRRNHLLFWAACRVLELRRQGAPDGWLDIIAGAGRRLGLPDSEVDRITRSAAKRVARG
jgi:hypothetical protein